MAGKTPVRPFTVANVIGYEKAIYTFNEVLFVIESTDQLKAELATYFDTLG